MATAKKAPAKKAPAKKATAKKTPAKTSSAGFSAEERAAMKARAREAKSKGGLADLLAKIEELPEDEAAIASRLHELVTAAGPELTPRTFYGMPAWAKDGKVLCFFQNASKFKVRYHTFGFQDNANLDDGAMWPTGFALRSLGPAQEKRITALVKQAVS